MIIVVAEEANGMEESKGQCPEMPESAIVEEKPVLVMKTSKLLSQKWVVDHDGRQATADSKVKVQEARGSATQPRWTALDVGRSESQDYVLGPKILDGWEGMIGCWQMSGRESQRVFVWKKNFKRRQGNPPWSNSRRLQNSSRGG